jgi:hypothetical protein
MKKKLLIVALISAAVLTANPSFAQDTGDKKSGKEGKVAVKSKKDKNSESKPESKSGAPIYTPSQGRNIRPTPGGAKTPKKPPTKEQ